MQTPPPTLPAASPGATASEFLARLPQAAAKAVRDARALAGEMGLELYLIGGTVRDLLLGLEPRDLDLLVNERGSALAAELAARWRSPLKLHEEFLTADLVAPSGLAVDIATMRGESYKEPGALPEVIPGSLLEDLARRDFTINTLGVSLSTAQDGGLIDHWGGLSDLASRRLRVLHDRSFIDDPTRALRGVRLVVELGFSFDDATRDLIRSAVATRAFDAVSGDRLWRELRLMWREIDGAGASLRELEALGLLGAVIPSHGDVEAAARALSDLAAQAPTTPPLRALIQSAGVPWVALSLLTSELDETVRDEVASRLDLVGAERKRLDGGGEAIQQLAAQLAKESLLPHEVYEVLGRRNETTQVLSWLACDVQGRERLAWYWGRGRETTLEVRGGDLVARGIEAGPVIGRALQETLRARLDGRLDAPMELEFALSVARGEADSSQGQANDD
ncbi:MAG TPA: hypothetical protein VKA53_01710 [Thermoanaerobaculia bacterium]|nr:hypothetical protein [Thermoanaerobaculia bacterium]